MIFKYSGDLKYGLVWILNGWKEVGLQMVWISNGIWNPVAQPYEIWTNGCHFFKNYLKSRQKCPYFEWSGFRMVGTIAKAKPFENWTIRNPTFECFWILNGTFSDLHCTGLKIGRSQIFFGWIWIRVQKCMDSGQSNKSLDFLTFENQTKKFGFRASSIQMINVLDIWLPDSFEFGTFTSRVFRCPISRAQPDHPISRSRPDHRTIEITDWFPWPVYRTY